MSISVQQVGLLLDLLGAALITTDQVGTLRQRLQEALARRVDVRLANFERPRFPSSPSKEEYSRAIEVFLAEEMGAFASLYSRVAGRDFIRKLKFDLHERDGSLGLVLDEAVVICPPLNRSTQERALSKVLESMLVTAGGVFMLTIGFLLQVLPAL
ncbi:hypothetical protein [Parvularcula dongshanensis]|uniref:Uncharacterized protein n=1 Tax=Parvularcula dongshanensis TaxID=1173995 RepID=A0A840I1E3_9PROT|nr:hypothetical protein [Parvularcula dongshanensis]MBB4658639.1 hypothetical protein [Parvularcula dongshanensis]